MCSVSESRCIASRCRTPHRCATPHSAPQRNAVHLAATQRNLILPIPCRLVLCACGSPRSIHRSSAQNRRSHYSPRLTIEFALHSKSPQIIRQSEPRRSPLHNSDYARGFLCAERTNRARTTAMLFVESASATDSKYKSERKRKQ